MLYLIIPSILIMIMLISSILMLVFGIKNLPKKYPSNDISPRFLNREAWGGISIETTSYFYNEFHYR